MTALVGGAAPAGSDRPTTAGTSTSRAENCEGKERWKTLRNKFNGDEPDHRRPPGRQDHKTTSRQPPPTNTAGTATAAVRAQFNLAGGGVGRPVPRRPTAAPSAGAESFQTEEKRPKLRGRGTTFKGRSSPNRVRRRHRRGHQPKGRIPPSGAARTNAGHGERLGLYFLQQPAILLQRYKYPRRRNGEPRLRKTRPDRPRAAGVKPRQLAQRAKQQAARRRSQPRSPAQQGPRRTPRHRGAPGTKLEDQIGIPQLQDHRQPKIKDSADDGASIRRPRPRSPSPELSEHGHARD